MTLTQLRYVVEVDRHRHFTRAAEACGVTQPTLSMQIRKLEKELGVDIFHRTPMQVRPTDVGRRIVEQAQTVLGEASRMREWAEEHAADISGVLRLGVIPTVAPWVLPPALPFLASRHPALSLVVEELKTSELLERIRDDRLDAGILATPEDLSGLPFRRLFREPFVGYLSAGHRLSDRQTLRRGDLRLDDLWLLQEGHCFRDQVLDLCSRVGPSTGPSGSLSFESGSLDTLQRLVDESGGMTLLPRLAAAALGEEERSRVRPFESPPPSRMVCLVHGRTYLKRAARDALIEVLLDSVPKDAVSIASDDDAHPRLSADAVRA